MSETYDPKTIEEKWQRVWEDARAFARRRTRRPGDSRPREELRARDAARTRRATLHMGHVLVYTIGDVVTHFRRRSGFAACCTRWASTRSACRPRTRRSRRAATRARSPSATSSTSARTMRRMGWCDRLGPRALDARSRATTAGSSGCSSASSSAGSPTARTRRSSGARTTRPCSRTSRCSATARCERCGALVESRVMEQWFFRITDYARRAARRPRDASTGPSRSRRASATGSAAPRAPRSSSGSRSWGEDVPVFTTRPDTLFGATFFVLAPEHALRRALTELATRCARTCASAAAKKTEERAAAIEKTASSPACTPSTRSTASGSRSTSPTTC